METLAYLYVVEEQTVKEQTGTEAVEAFESQGGFLIEQLQDDERCELMDAEVDALEQSVVWMMP